MKKPLCELCNIRHSTWEPHEFPTEVVTKPVTKVPETVTKLPPVTKVMGRPRKYVTHAERQAAYRARKR